jgi:hypothetical protein
MSSACPSTGRGRHVDHAFDAAVKVPDVDSSVRGAGVQVLLPRGAGRREVAPDEGFEDRVAGVGGYAAVKRVSSSNRAGVILLSDRHFTGKDHPAVIESGGEVFAGKGVIGT